MADRDFDYDYWWSRGDARVPIRDDQVDQHVILSHGERVRIIGMPTTYAKLVESARRGFGIDRYMDLTFLVKHMLPSGVVIEAELDESAYHLLNDRTEIRCVYTVQYLQTKRQAPAAADSHLGVPLGTGSYPVAGLHHSAYIPYPMPTSYLMPTSYPGYGALYGYMPSNGLFLDPKGMGYSTLGSDLPPTGQKTNNAGMATTNGETTGQSSKQVPVKKPERGPTTGLLNPFSAGASSRNASTIAQKQGTNLQNKQGAMNLPPLRAPSHYDNYRHKVQARLDAQGLRDSQRLRKPLLFNLEREKMRDASAKLPVCGQKFKASHDNGMLTVKYTPAEGSRQSQGPMLHPNLWKPVITSKKHTEVPQDKGKGPIAYSPTRMSNLLYNLAHERSTLGHPSKIKGLTDPVGATMTRGDGKKAAASTPVEVLLEKAKPGRFCSSFLGHQMSSIDDKVEKFHRSGCFRIGKCACTAVKTILKHDYASWMTCCLDLKIKCDCAAIQDKQEGVPGTYLETLGAFLKEHKFGAAAACQLILSLHDARCVSEGLCRCAYGGVYAYHVCCHTLCESGKPCDCRKDQLSQRTSDESGGGEAPSKFKQSGARDASDKNEKRTSTTNEGGFYNSLINAFKEYNGLPCWAEKDHERWDDGFWDLGDEYEDMEIRRCSEERQKRHRESQRRPLQNLFFPLKQCRDVKKKPEDGGNGDQVDSDKNGKGKVLASQERANGESAVEEREHEEWVSQEVCSKPEVDLSEQGVNALSASLGRPMSPEQLRSPALARVSTPVGPRTAVTMDSPSVSGTVVVRPSPDDDSFMFRGGWNWANKTAQEKREAVKRQTDRFSEATEGAGAEELATKSGKSAVKQSESKPAKVTVWSSGKVTEGRPASDENGSNSSSSSWFPVSVEDATDFEEDTPKSVGSSGSSNLHATVEDNSDSGW